MNELFLKTVFYMLFVEGCDSPKFKHEDYSQALKESKRLADKTQKPVYILKTFAVVNIAPKYIVDEINEDDLPQWK